MKKKDTVFTSIPTAVHAYTCIRLATQSQAMTTPIGLLQSAIQGRTRKPIFNKIHSSQGLNKALKSVAVRPNRALQVQKETSALLNGAIPAKTANRQATKLDGTEWGFSQVTSRKK
jgi:hypothetical protein